MPIWTLRKGKDISFLPFFMPVIQAPDFDFYAPLLAYIPSLKRPSTLLLRYLMRFMLEALMSMWYKWNENKSCYI
jgi:hypothetical protein